MTDTTLTTQSGSASQSSTFRQPRSDYFREPDQFYQGLLSNSSTLLYTAPVGNSSSAVPSPKAQVTEIIIANTDSSARNVTLYFVPYGGSVGDANTIMKAVPFPANSFTKMEFLTILKAGWMIYGFADTTNKVCLTISGVKFLIVPNSP